MWRDQKGQSLTEFALIVPLILLLLCGIVDFGRLSFHYMQLHMVAQESARLGGLGKDDSEIIQFAQDRLMNGVEQLQVHIHPIDSARNPGEYVTVSLHVPFQAVTPVFSHILPESFQIETQSTMRVE